MRSPDECVQSQSTGVTGFSWHFARHRYEAYKWHCVCGRVCCAVVFWLELFAWFDSGIMTCTNSIFQNVLASFKAFHVRYYIWQQQIVFSWSVSWSTVGCLSRWVCQFYWVSRTHALVTKKRIHLLTLILGFKSSGQLTQWTECLAKTNALSTQFTGVSICHPMYDDKHMLNTYSQTCNCICLE
jgi:hypothetical protein